MVFTHCSPRRRRRKLVGAALTVSLVFGGASVAGAQQDPSDVDTSATVGSGGGTAPNIQCAWALNDIDHNWTNFMQYGNDDDHPDGPNAPAGVTDGAPCVADGVLADQEDGWTDVIEVKPNAHDLPTLAYVELWAAVTSNSPSSTIVRWDVYHPDGTPKVQIDGTRYTTDPTRCAGPTGMLNAAVSTGQMTSGARSNIVAECTNQQKNYWYGAFPISKHQPYGTYRIEVTASIAGGAQTVLTYYITVMSFYQLEKDFNTVDFGSVGVNNHYWQTPAGDFAFGSGGPTLRNTGNAGIGLDVSFDPLCKQAPGVTSCSDLKRIDLFDALFGARVLGNVQYKGTNPDGTPNAALALAGNTNQTGSVVNNAPDTNPALWHSFDNTFERTLCPNDVGKFQASIYTQSIETGSYSGELFLRGRLNPACPTDVGSVYNAAPTIPATGYWS